MWNKTLAGPTTSGRWFWPSWGAAFLGFPIGGAAATLLVGPIESVGAALIAGTVAGGVIGAAQWLVLRRRLPLLALWVAATADGMPSGWHSAGAPGRQHDHAAAAPARTGRRSSCRSSAGRAAAGHPPDSNDVGGGRDPRLAARLGSVGHNRTRPDAELDRVRLERSADVSTRNRSGPWLPAAAKRRSARARASGGLRVKRSVRTVQAVAGSPGRLPSTSPDWLQTHMEKPGETT